LNKHILRGKNKQKMIFNIASDMAINQYIDNLPKHALLPERFKLPRNKESEYYYRKLFKNMKTVEIEVDGGSQGGKDKGKDKQGQGQGKEKKKGVLDNHSVWEKGNKNKDYQHQVIKTAIKKTLNNTKDYGNLPANIQAEIQKALFHETANWKAILQRFLHRATIVHTLPTRKKMNRRYGFYYDGSRVECKLELLIAIDTSGSISDNDLSLFFAEIDKIKALGMKITIAEIDTAVHKVYPYKNQPHIVSGRGGTDFVPLFQKAKRLTPQPNAIIYLTDLYANLKFKNPTNIPTLWAITQNGGNIKDIPFGSGIKLKDDIGSV